MAADHSAELARKLGQATAVLNALHGIWKKASISKTRKLQLLASLMLSKLMYGVCSAWLPQSDLRRLDGFQARCLRRLMGIKPSFPPTANNEKVRQLAGSQPPSTSVRQQQLHLMHQVPEDSEKHCLRRATCSMARADHLQMSTSGDAADLDNAGRTR